MEKNCSSRTRLAAATRPLTLATACLCALAVSVAPARAQTFDVPSFNTPFGEDGWGVYLIFQDFDGAGGMGTWRKSGANLDVGIRAALVDRGNDLGLFGGVDLKNEFYRADDNFPLDMGWVTGIGLGGVPDRDSGVIRIPGGVSFGREVPVNQGSSILRPYVYPRLGLDVAFFPRRQDGDTSDVSLHFDVDLGLDWQFQGNFAARIALTLGHNEALGIGLSF